MKEERFFYMPDAASANELSHDEATHAVRVLRLTAGSEIVLMDGQGNYHRAEVTMAHGHHCTYRIVESVSQQRQWLFRLHLAIAPTKMMERMEWLAEKATEVGIDNLTFLDCRFSERTTVKTERIEKIVISAMKQSRKAWLPCVEPMTDFKRFITTHTTGLRYIAHCYNEIPRTNLFSHLSWAVGSQPDDADIVVLIGPEGDFSIDEVREALAAGYISVDLGPCRLRTETAGLAALMAMHHAQQNMTETASEPSTH